MFKAYFGGKWAAVNQNYVIHVAMNGCKNLKIKGQKHDPGLVPYFRGDWS